MFLSFIRVARNLRNLPEKMDGVNPRNGGVNPRNGDVNSRNHVGNICHPWTTEIAWLIRV